MPVVVVVVAEVAVAVVNKEDGVQCRRWGGHSMAVAASNGDGDGLRLGDGEAKMAIDRSSGGGGWGRWVSVFDDGNG